MNLQHSQASSPVARRGLAAQRLNPPAPQAEASDFDAAMAEYTHQNYRNAFDALARLAESGHPDAARMALLMVAHGTRLYGRRFEAGAASRRRWLALSTLPQEVA